MGYVCQGRPLHDDHPIFGGNIRAGFGQVAMEIESESDEEGLVTDDDDEESSDGGIAV